MIIRVLCLLFCMPMSLYCALLSYKDPIVPQSTPVVPAHFLTWFREHSVPFQEFLDEPAEYIPDSEWVGFRLDGTNSSFALDLSYYHITSENLRSYLATASDDIRTIDLSHNQITNIHWGTFARFTHLTHIDLSHNQISSIGGDIALHLPTVSSILLHHNMIKELPDDLIMRFPTHDAPDKLDLSFNNLVALNPLIFLPVMKTAQRPMEVLLSGNPLMFTIVTPTWSNTKDRYQLNVKLIYEQASDPWKTFWDRFKPIQR